jgi:very-short-patch-repair endonuclease
MMSNQKYIKAKKDDNITLDKIDELWVKQWHPTANGDKKPEQFTRTSKEKITWVCQNNIQACGCSHIWISTIYSRVMGRGCPFCSHHRVCPHESLQILFPDIAKQWHPTLNGTLKPTDIRPYSNKKIWWLCEKQCDYGCKHIYKTFIYSRTKGNTECPFCSGNKVCKHSSLKAMYPEIAEQFNKDKNIGITTEQLAPHSNLKVEWKCTNIFLCGCLHEWKTKVNDRVTSGSGCPFCARKSICEHQSITYTHKELLCEWDYEKNDINPNQISFGSNRYAHWKCKKGHEWKTTIQQRCSGKTGCPLCVNKTEGRMLNYLTKHFEIDNVIPQFKLAECKNKKSLRFDFCLNKQKLIVELDGRQHFEQVMTWDSPEIIREKDVFKMQYAIKNNYVVVRIYQPDVWNHDEKWLDDNFLPMVKKAISNRKNVFLSIDENKYNEHIKLLNSGIPIILNKKNGIITK